MNKLPTLLTQLNENGINGAYSDIMADISKLIQDVAKAEGEVQSKINTLVADKKYDDIARFTSIPQQINECVQEIDTMFKTVPAVDKQKAPELPKAEIKPEIKKEEKEKPVPVKQLVPPVITSETPVTQETEKAEEKVNKPEAPAKPIKVIDNLVSVADDDPFFALMED